MKNIAKVYVFEGKEGRRKKTGKKKKKEERVYALYAEDQPNF